jgi:hypothetical protein
MAATPSPNYADKQLLASDQTFQNRIRQAMIAGCISVKNEALSVAYHRERETFVVAVINQPDTYKPLFAYAVAADTAVINDATVNGATPLTSANVAAQAALVTDAHIDTALAASFNTFFRTPAN